MLDEQLRPLAVEQLPGRRALAGETPEPLIVRSRPAGQRETRWTRVKATPVFDEDGSVRLAINVIEDITELKRAEQGQRFLAEAGRVLAGSLDYEETLSSVARLAVPDIADWCGIDVLADGELARVAVAHVDPEKIAEATEIAVSLPARPGRPERRPRRAAHRALGGLRRHHRRAAGGRRPRRGAPGAAPLGRA